MDNVNDAANEFQEMNVVLSHINVNRLEDLNNRYVLLQSYVVVSLINQISNSNVITQ